MPNSTLSSLESHLRFRQNLLAQTPQFGLFSRLADPEVMTCFASSDIDFVIIDAEHSFLDRGAISQLVASARSGGLAALIRYAHRADLSDIHFAMAAGAAGVVITHVSNAHEAQEISTYARTTAVELSYAGLGRDAQYRQLPWEQYQRMKQSGFAVVLQIDTREGHEAGLDISGVDGIDAIFIASLSLALSLGHDDPAHPEVSAAIDGICRHCAAAGKSVATHVLDQRSFATWRDRGASLFVIGNELNLLRKGASAAKSAFC